MNNQYKDGKENPFDDDRPELSMVELDQAIYGTVDGLPASQRVNVKRINIQAIMADSQQPRRMVPSEIRRELPEYYRKPVEALERWHQLAEEIYGEKIDIMVNLMAKGDGKEEDSESGGIVESFFSLMALASSIRRDGLTNPITIIVRSNDDIKYVIDTGERRWLAHHLLAAHRSNSQKPNKYEQIAARIVARPDVWRQATENNSREKLNAISKARQLALLLMDLHEDPQGGRFNAIDDPLWEDRNEREFYAQVASGARFNIKQNEGKRILDATGITSRNALSRIRALLTIPDQIWDLADDGDWAEGRIRATVDELKPLPVVPDQTIGERWVDEKKTPPIHLLTELLAEISTLIGKYPVAQKLTWLDVSRELIPSWREHIVDVIKYLNMRGYFVAHHRASTYDLFLDTDDVLLSQTHDYVVHSPSSTDEHGVRSNQINYTDDPVTEDEDLESVDWSQEPVPSDPLIDPRMKTKILGEHPEDLTTMLMFLRQMAAEEGNLTLQGKLGWLIDMTRDNVDALTKNNPVDFCADWLNTIDDEIAGFVDTMIKNFRCDFEQYLTQLSAIADEVQDGSE